MSKEIEDIVNSLTEANYSGSIKSIAVVFLDSSNDLRIMFDVPNDVLLSTLGAIQVLSNTIAANGLKQIPNKDCLK